jgi:L-fuculose-phosphate aldolase
MSNSAESLRKEMVRVGQMMYDRGLVGGLSGNLSVRTESGSFLVTPSGIAKGFLLPEHMLEVDQVGDIVTPAEAGGKSLHPTSELPMHLEAYSQRPDVSAVIHAHPTLSIALSIAGIDFNQPLVPEALVLLGEIPTAAYATPSSEEDRLAIRDLIPNHDAIVLSHHGTLTVGKDLWQALMRLETLEQTAKIIAWSSLLGEPRFLNADQLRKLGALRASLGLPGPQP